MSCGSGLTGAPAVDGVPGRSGGAAPTYDLAVPVASYPGQRATVLWSASPSVAGGDTGGGRS
jgi:hypothetical protein